MRLPKAWVDRIRRDPRIAFRIVVVLCSVPIAAGAYGSWGSLSVVPEQGRIVETTRHLLAVVGLVAALTTLPAKFRLFFAAQALVAFLFIGVITYGEWDYADVQTHYYETNGSESGFLLLMWGSVLGFLASAAELVAWIQNAAERRRPSHPGPNVP